MNKTFTDPAFPGISAVLDPARIEPLLRSAFPEFKEAIKLSKAQVKQIDCIAGTSCNILYNLRLWIRKKEVIQYQPLKIKLLKVNEQAPAPAEDILDLYERNPLKILSLPYLKLEELHALVEVFPFDSDLPWLLSALDTKIMKKQLNILLEPKKQKVFSIKIKLLGYKPGLRAALHYKLQVKHQGLKKIEPLELIAKIHAYRNPALIFASSWALWQTLGEKARIPRPFGFIPCLAMTLQEKVPGKPLGRLNKKTNPFVHFLGETARNIAALHLSTLPLTRSHKAHDEIKLLSNACKTLTSLSPSNKSRIMDLCDHLKENIQSQAVVTGPIHGDFHMMNIFTFDKHIYLMDTDDIAHGDCLVDVSRFLASLRISSLYQKGNLKASEKNAAIFLNAYLKSNPQSTARLPFYEASSLLIEACHLFRKQRIHDKAVISSILDFAEELLKKPRGACFSQTGTSSHLNGGQSQLPDKERLRWALDEQYMQGILSSPIRKKHDANLLSCRVVNHLDSSTFDQITYQLSGWKSDKRWNQTVKGYCWNEYGGKKFLDFLEKIQKKLNEASSPAILPSPIQHFSDLALLALEMPTGISYFSILESLNTYQAGHLAGKALASLHNLKIDSSFHLRTHDAELSRLEKRILSLSKSAPDLGQQMLALLKSIRQKISNTPSQSSVILRNFNLYDIYLMKNGQVAFTQIGNLAQAHPFIDIGNFTAQLTSLGLRYNKAGASGKMIEGFLFGYKSANNRAFESLPAFEAMGLLRQICIDFGKEPKSQLGQSLLNLAKNKLE